MFNRNPPVPTAPAKGSPTSRAISILGTAFGFGAAVMLTPLAFNLAKAPLYAFLSEAYGDSLGALCTWAMGFLMALVIGVSVSLFVTMAATSAIVSLAARRVS